MSWYSQPAFSIAFLTSRAFAMLVTQHVSPKRTGDGQCGSVSVSARWLGINRNYSVIVPIASA